MVFYDGCNWDSDGLPGEYVYGEDIYIDSYYMDERWKPICDFSGYWISNKGRVWSVATKRFLKPFSADNWGHLGVYLCKNGKRYHKYIHRLMAEAFILNPNMHTLVRHLDDIPDNNVVENLAWGTCKDNTQDAIRNNHFKFATSIDREKAYAACRTPIVAIDLRSGREYYFEGIGIAARALDISRTSIYRVLNGFRDSVNDYQFSYATRRRK